MEQRRKCFWINPLLILPGLILPLASCVKDVVMDAKERPQVVVACILSDDPVQELHLSFTKGASLQQAPPLTEAEAVLTDLTEWEEAGRFSRDADGVWRLDYAAKPEHRYRLDVRVPGYAPLWAEDTMPGKLRFYLQSRYWLARMVESPTGYWNDWCWDVDGDGAFSSSGSIWNDGENLPRGETYFAVGALEDPVWIYAMNYNPETGRREIAEAICTEYNGVDDFNLTGETYAPPQWEEEIPYPVRREYAALLAETHTKALYPWLEGCPMHRRYLRLFPREEERPGHHFLGFGVSGTFRGRYNCEDHCFYRSYDLRDSRCFGYVRNLAKDEGYVVCMSISEQYDNYLAEVCRAQEVQASTDLSTIYLRDNLSTNIKDDKGNPTPGIFGCKVERHFQWSAEGAYVDYDRSQFCGSFQESASWNVTIPESELKELRLKWNR